MKKILWVIIFLSIVYFFSWEINLASIGKDFPLKVYFLNVGQGDAILINYLVNYQVLIDAGPSGEKLLSEMGKYMPRGDKKIELVILTHPDKDHLAGFLDLLDNFQIDLFLTNGQKTESQVWLNLEEKIKEKSIKTEALYEGSFWQIGENLKFSVFNPDEDNNENKEEKNDQSVVLEMNFGENSFLFTGDVEIKTEEDLINDGEIQDIDWLKIAHHGSKNSTSEKFLNQSRPEFAIISVGENSYGHPTNEVLERLEKSGTQVFRTDKEGTIGVFCQNLTDSCQINFFRKH